MIAASDALSYVKAALRSHEGPKGVDESYDAWAIRMIRVDTLQTLAAGLEEALSHTPEPKLAREFRTIVIDNFGFWARGEAVFAGLTAAEMRETYPGERWDVVEQERFVTDWAPVASGLPDSHPDKDSE